MSNTVTAALILTIGIASSPAFAAPPGLVTQPEIAADADDENDAADIVVTGSGVAQKEEEVGQAITVITRDEIERRQTVAISDLLATTPGVTVSRNGGLGTLTTVRIRGAEGEQTLTIIDGVRVNDPSSPGGGFDFANLLAGSIDRIEVLRGPNSVPWGSQAIGGVVNIVTQQPSEGLQGRGNIEYGEHDSLFANAGVSGGKGGFTAALTGGYLRTDGISAAANGTEADGYRQYGATGKIGVEFAPGIGLDLRGYYADSHVESDGFPPPDYVLADDADYSDTREIYGYAGLHADILGDRLRNRIAFTIADVDRDNFDPDFPSISRGRSERYEYQGDFRVINQLRLVAGAEHEDARFVSGTADDGFADRRASSTTSFYGEAIVTPVRQLAVTGGVRRDDNRDYRGRTSFGANAALALGEGTTLRASYADGFKAPTLYQRFANFYGTPDLKPETARSYDFGIAQSGLGGRASASVIYFHRDTRNQIDFDNATFTYQNLDRTRAEGIEFDLALRPVDALTFTGEYSYIDSENRSPGANFGNDLARRPHQTVSVSGDYRFPFGLSIGATVLHVGDSFDDAGNFTRLDGYALTGVRAAMAIGHGLSVYGRIDNVTGERYQTAAGYGADGRAAYGGIRVKLD